MGLLKKISLLNTHRHNLRIVDCKMSRNGHKLYGVICRKCLTIVEAGITHQEAEEVIRRILRD
jgi:hypothetical protein